MQQWVMPLFAPAHVVDGISYLPGNNTGCILSYPDAHRYRLGGWGQWWVD